MAEFHIGSQQAANIYQADSITIGSPPSQTPEEAPALGLRLKKEQEALRFELREVKNPDGL